MRSLICTLLLFTTAVAFGQDVVINEFMADNDTTVADQDGDFDDWVELYNPGDEAVNLNGFGLSDDPDDLMQWVFPDTSIAARGFLIIWTDDDEDQEGLHTNFKLSSSGEDVCLATADGSLLDQVTFGPQYLDISFGRYPDGTGEFQFMYPTCGEPNTSDGPEETVPGDGLFEPFTIHKIELHFYVDAWQDSMAYNYEVLDEEYLPCQVTYNDTMVLDSVGIRYKGNSTYTLSQGTPKKPLTLKFDKFNDAANFFDLDKLNLHNGVCDPTFMRETIAYSIAREYMPAPRTTYADVYVDGELLGFYTLVEQVDELFLARHFENNGYNLYKAGDDGAPLVYYGDDQSEYEEEYELKTNDDENDWARFVEMISVLNNTDNDEFVSVVGQILDFDSCLKLLAYNMVLSNFDSYTGSARNYYFYDYETNGQFVMMPWDVNEAFGVYSNGWDVIDQDILAISNLDDRPLNRRLLEQGSLQSIYLDYISEILDGAAHPDSVAALVVQLAPLLESHVLADENKLYTDNMFYRNLEGTVTLSDGRRVPGLTSFSQQRYDVLQAQLSSELVYPGDTNNDGVVSAEDILPIGVYFLTSGTGRSCTSNRWNGQRCTPWTELAATYADANGDGSVDEQDVVAIGVNWSKTHLVAEDSFLGDSFGPEVLEEYRENFTKLYNSLSGNGEAVTRMRTLLESVVGETNALPTELSLAQNYPNPFNSSTIIQFSLPQEQDVTLTLINVLGQEVQQLIRGQHFAPGTHQVRLDGSGLASGIYFYRLETANQTMIRKLVYSK